MVVAKDNLLFAVRNVAHWGDTDVLPYPLENHWFHDAEDPVTNLLLDLDERFEEWLAEYPLDFDRVLSAVGYLGFRAVTQIDPIWNAYLLALVVEMGPEIEDNRLPTEHACVFSYRYAPDPETYTLFARDIGWGAFQSRALALAHNYPHVLSTDISDFYPRVYHHRVENALSHATKNRAAVSRCKKLLSLLAVGGVSYGLPIGGNAARLLAELVLNRTDRLLRTEGVVFCRFVDDYYLFGKTKEEARQSLAYLAEILSAHEGLSLQRAKTRLMSGEEFARTSPVAALEAADSEDQSQAQEFLKIRLRYDPYSPTADDDFDRLQEELERFDIVGMLGRELKKSRVDEVLVRQLVKSIRFLETPVLAAAVDSLVGNLEVLHPIFPTVAMVLRGLLEHIPTESQSLLNDTLRRMIRDGSHVFLIPANLCYAARLLAHSPEEDTNLLFAQLYQRPNLPSALRRDLVLAMARRGDEPWVADTIRRTAPRSHWERRALLTASYILGDEGKHFRGRAKAQLHKADEEFARWIGEKNNSRAWEIPL